MLALYSFVGTAVLGIIPVSYTHLGSGYFNIGLYALSAAALHYRTSYGRRRDFGESGL